MILSVRYNKKFMFWKHNWPMTIEKAVGMSSDLKGLKNNVDKK